MRKRKITSLYVALCVQFGIRRLLVQKKAEPAANVNANDAELDDMRRNQKRITINFQLND